MENSLDLPTGLPTTPSKGAKIDVETRTAIVDSPQAPLEPVVQRTEDNPRAGDSVVSRGQDTLSTSLSRPTDPPLLGDAIVQPPQLLQAGFSTSPWARRNAKIKAIMSSTPKAVLPFFIFFAQIFCPIWCLCMIYLLIFGPATFAILLGAVVCQASNLGHIPISLVPRLGASGGFMISFMTVWLTLALYFGYSGCCKRSSSWGPRRKFEPACPVLMTIPIVFLDCLLGGFLGYYLPFGTPFTYSPRLSGREVALMLTIGSSITSPLFPATFLLLCGVLEAVWRTVRELMQRHPINRPLTILPYLGRQLGPFKNLLPCVGRQKSGLSRPALEGV